MKIKTILILLLSISACSTFAQGLLSGSQKQVLGSNNIIAVVEDRVITREEVMREVSPFLPQIKAQARSEFEFNQHVNAYIKEIVQNMVDRELIVKEFNDKGMMIPQSYLDNNFEDYLQKEFNGDRAEFLKFVQAKGQTVKEFKDNQKKEIIVGFMRNQKRQTAAELSPAKITQYYEDNKSKWYSPATAKLSQITLKTSTYATVDDNKKLADEIITDLKNGEDFADLAKRYSKDETASKGGEWGWYKKGDLSPVLDSKVFAAKVGDVIEPVVISDMIFILKVEDMKPEGVQSIADVREKIEWAIIDEASRATFKKWLEGLRRNGFVKYYQ